MSLLAGVILGLSVAAPVGPIGLLCIHRTLEQGAGAGFATGLGAATVHCGYGIVITAGFGSLALQFVQTKSTIWPVICAVAFFWLALRLVLRADNQTVQIERRDHHGLMASYSSAVLLGLINPATIVLFAAASPLLIPRFDLNSTMLTASGVFLGSAVWWLTLTWAVFSFRSTLTSTLRRYINNLAALIFVGFSLSFLLSALNLH